MAATKWILLLIKMVTYMWSPTMGIINVEIGGGVDVLQKFGIMGDMLFGSALNIKDVLTNEIISNVNQITEIVNVTNSNKEVKLTFCPDLDTLFDSYFNGFQVDLSDKPWKLLTASWSTYTISERFGISDMALAPNYQFVVVSYRRPIKRFKSIQNLTQLVELKPSVSKKLKSISVGIESTVTNFVAEYGSHFVDEYTIGDTVFQVFTYLPTFYNKFQKCIKNNCSDSESSVFLSPVYAEHVGQVMSIGNRYDDIEKWADTNLTRNSRLGGTYNSLFAIKSNPELLNEVTNLMDDESVLEIHLKVISSFLNDTVTQKWFTEVLDNHVKLREINL
ncbi:torso-like protein [Daktulosphaira vitifoliae]|uniref:torso-like protein n=1 Tax=Daktulosphaira vitifoliae TaxID=58002 RepID=UPI0021A9A110|nr:torso-like protein [Daktulosphaira vitifoliae]